MNYPQITGMRAFYIILMGLFISALGSYMTMFGLSVWVFQKTGSATAFSILIFFAIIPQAIGAFFAGPYVDRWNRRQVMIWSDVTAALSTLCIMALFYLGMLQQWHLYIMFTISGLAASFFFPAFHASFPMLVPKEQLGRASGQAQLISALIPIISAPLAGFLVTEWGLGVVFIVDFTTFLVNVFVLSLVLIPQPTASDNSGSESFLADLAFGLRYIVVRKPLLYLISLIALFVFINGIFAALLGPLVMNIADAQTFGVVYAAFGLGALVSSSLLSVWGGPKRRMHGILIGMFMASVGAIIAGVWATPIMIALGILLFAAGYVFLSSLSNVTYQVKAAPDVLGRIFALIAVINLGMQAASTLIAGPLATDIFEPLLAEGGVLSDSVGSLIGIGKGRGIGLMYIGGGVILLFIALIATLTPHVRLLEDDLPDYAPPNGPSDTQHTATTPQPEGG